MVTSNWKKIFENIPRSGQPTETEKSDISGTRCLFSFLTFPSHVMKKPIPKECKCSRFVYIYCSVLWGTQSTKLL